MDAMNNDIIDLIKQCTSYIPQARPANGIEVWKRITQIKQKL